MDNDGREDLIALRYRNPSRGLWVAKSGFNHLGKPVFVPQAWWRGSTITGDYGNLAADTTGDGAADFILVDTTGVRVVPANPRWFDTPAQWSTIPFHGTKKTLTADLDADGDGDLIAVNDTVQVMRSTGTGYAAPEPWHTGPFFGTKETLAADVDGDHDADLVAVNATDVWVLRTQ